MVVVSANKGEAGPGSARHGWARHGTAWLGEARRGRDSFELVVVPRIKARPGTAWLGRAVRGMAMQGKAGTLFELVVVSANNGKAGPGAARHGAAWRGRDSFEYGGGVRE